MPSRDLSRKARDILYAVMQAYPKVCESIAEKMVVVWADSARLARVKVKDEIGKAASWENEQRTKKRDKLRFLNNWLVKAADNAPTSDEADLLMKFWNSRFKETHGGLEYEPGDRDYAILHDIQDRRGLIKTFVLIEEFFMREEEGSMRWRHFAVASRNIGAWKSGLNSILDSKKVQTAIRDRLPEVEAQLRERGFLRKGK